jgi:tripartite-type tricarboxylate transporter receptor subunit TctC
VRKISDDLRAVVAAPDVSARLTAIGSVPRTTSPDETTAFIQSEQRIWGPLLERMAREQ